MQGVSAMSNSKLSPNPSPFQKANACACFRSSQTSDEGVPHPQRGGHVPRQGGKKSMPVVERLPITMDRNVSSATCRSVTSVPGQSLLQSFLASRSVGQMYRIPQTSRPPAECIRIRTSGDMHRLSLQGSLKHLLYPACAQGRKYFRCAFAKEFFCALAG